MRKFFIFISVLFLALILLLVFLNEGPWVYPGRNSGEAVERVAYSQRIRLLSNENGDYFSSLLIENPGEERTEFSINIQDALFRDRGAVIEAVRSMPDAYKDEPDYIKAWRFVSSRHYHSDPFIAGTKTHDPLLAINSIGYGYCDDVSEVLATIWGWLGYEARVWALEGHVVPEVLVNGDWRMFDPDYAIYYFGRDGEIASVEEISKDPLLISDPINPIWPKNYPGYDVKLGEIYDAGEGDDNYVFEASAVKEHPVSFEVPGKSLLEFPVKFDKPVLSYYGSVTPLVGAAALSLKAGTVGEIDLPFVILDVSGEGRVEIEGNEYTIGSRSVGTYLRGDESAKIKPASAVTRVNIIEAKSDIKIIMSLNPILAYGTPNSLVEVFQPRFSPRVRVMQHGIANGFLDKVFYWFGELFFYPKRDSLSATSDMLVNIGKERINSPIRLRDQLYEYEAMRER